MVERKTKSNKKSGKANTRQNKTKMGMPNMSSLKEQMGLLKNRITQFVKENHLSPSELGKAISRHWSMLFNKHLTNKQVKSMTEYYMRTLNKGKKGGALTGAPLSYSMGPGMPASTTYGVFPTEAGADIKASQHLDVYYNSGMGRSCGTENTTATVPKDMGSNLVPAKGGRRTMKRKGGNFMSSLAARSYISNNPAGTGQIMGESWSGKPISVYDNYRPEYHAWKPVSTGTVPIFPSVTAIKSDMTQIASATPYPGVTR